jgi:hypothetical protein
VRPAPGKPCAAPGRNRRNIRPHRRAGRGERPSSASHLAVPPLKKHRRSGVRREARRGRAGAAEKADPRALLISAETAGHGRLRGRPSGRCAG